jgi:hypothetical protein
VVLDAEHRPLVGACNFLVHARHPALPARDQGRTHRFLRHVESEWRLKRSHHSDDVNAELREAVVRDGYPLFPGCRSGEIPKS